MQRTNSRHAAALFIALTLSTVTAICGLFLLTDTQIPGWFVIAGRWLPALVTLLVLRLVPLPGGVAHWWALRPGGWRRLLVGGLATLVTLIAVYTVSALLVGALGLAGTQISTVLGQLAFLLFPMVLAFSLSTLGEEAAWRGFLQQTLADHGFWRSSATVAAVWVLFHVPLHGVMALQGTIPWVIAVVTTVGLFPLGLFLSAVVARFGSVWPAVLGHALPFSALNLLTDVDALPVGVHWALAAVTAALLVAAAALMRWPRGASHLRRPAADALPGPARR